MNPTTKTAFTFLQDYFAQQGYALSTDHTFQGLDWTVDCYAHREGRTLGVLKYNDHLFMHDFDPFRDDDEHLEAVHQSARKAVNSQIKTPKLLRLTVPNITTLAVSSLGFSDYVKGLLRTTQHGIAASGGEIHARYLIDVPERQLYTQGLAYTFVTGEARILFGAEKAFAHNPANRMYATVQAAAAALFEQLDRL